VRSAQRRRELSTGVPLPSTARAVPEGRSRLVWRRPGPWSHAPGRCASDEPDQPDDSDKSYEPDDPNNPYELNASCDSNESYDLNKSYESGQQTAIALPSWL
jgi:hypothetical protein